MGGSIPRPGTKLKEIMSTPILEAAAALTHEQKLDRLAEVAIRVGLGLRRGQELVMTASLDTLPLVRRITEHAYKAGASLVTTFLTDEESTLLRYQHGENEGFDYAPSWLYDGIAAAFKSGAARLAIAGGNPALLSQQDPEKVGRANRAVSKAYRPALELITRHDINWTIVAAATPAWAATVFPDLPADQALAKLWDAIFAASRADLARLRRCLERARRQPPPPLRSPQREALRRAALQSAGNRSTCRPRRRPPLARRRHHRRQRPILHPQHAHRRGLHHAAQGPHRRLRHQHQAALASGNHDRRHPACASKAAASSKPKPSRGEEVLNRMIETDEGARRLGEVALVPHSSPIAQSGLLFNNTLFDENAASHIALGQAYSTCLKDGDKLTPAQLAKLGANESLIHVDWMIGSGKMDVDGITAEGKAEPIMRQGEWV